MSKFESRAGASKSLGKRKDRQGYEDGRRAKKQRGEVEEQAHSGSGDTLVIERNLPKISVLQQEERAFPRGGGSVLTPLERKQIEVQATKDVLFEESGGKRPKDDDATSDEDLAENTEATGPAPSKKRKTSKKKFKGTEEDDAPESQIRADGLKPKRLMPGCLVLGMISHINAHSLSLDLPNNLRGSVSIVAISKVLTQRLEALAAAEEIDTEGQTRDKNEDIDLEAHFSIGQYLRGCVVAPADNPDDDPNKKKKRVQLSTDPRQTNQGMAKSDITINTMIQASVVSVEDHGLVMDMGIEDSSIKGFMSTKEIPEDVQINSIGPGTVFLCLVIGITPNGNVIKLSANLKRAKNLSKSEAVSMPPTVKSLLPGLAVEVLVSQVSSSTIAGKIMGSIDASADVVHSGAGSRKINIESKYKPGMKVKARIIFANPGSQTDTLAISILDHVLSLSPPRLDQTISADPTVALPIGSIVEKAKVITVEPALGVFTDVSINGIPAFVHISRVSDERVESLSQSIGKYRSGTSHRARIIGYNAIDAMFLASFEKAVLEQKYIRMDDIPVGELFQVKVEKIVINATGVVGLLVNIAKGINGFIPEMHMSDVHLQYPERKFKEGITVPARVLSVNKQSRQVRLTLKKALITSDAPIWTEYNEITAGTESVGTIHEIKQEGAIVRFFGPVKAFLPVSQMSDTFIEDPTKHFRIGQSIKVHVLSVDPTVPRMMVSCRIPSATEVAESAEFAKLKPGQFVNGLVTEKSSDDINLEITGSKLRANLRMGHFTDGSEQKCVSAMKHIRVGQTMSDLLIVELFPKKKSIILSNKPSLVGDAKNGKFLMHFEETIPDMKVNGFVRNITEEGVFVAFGNGLTGLLHRSQVTESMSKLPDFGLRKDQSIVARISYVDHSLARFNLSMKDTQDTSNSNKVDAAPAKQPTNHQVDGESINLAEFTIGKLTTAQISSVKETQLNVRLAKNIQGRIDVSEAFNKWEDIKNPKFPLRAFQANESIPVRILGTHDARNHRFLPISHRGGKVPVFELSAKVNGVQSLLSLDQITIGSWLTAFVNNVSDRCLWLNVSPNVRGRIDLMDISEDVSVLGDLDANFPIGSAIRVRVKNIDLANGRLDLSAKDETGDVSASLDSFSVGMITSGRVTKVTERLVIVQLGPTIAGSIYLTELGDDFTQADPGAYSKNDVVRVCVLDIDKPNKRIVLSTRPSKVLSSSLTVTDRYIATIDQLKVHDTVRGFVKNVADSGLFVSLSHSVTAFVRVAELSDIFIKDWKASFEVDRLVTGRIIAIDVPSKHVQMSLKPSVVSENYIAPITFNDLHVGKVITGKIRKVEEFGAFIVVDNSHNVSGLCHRSEMAEQRVPDARKLYEEGDVVKAIVLKMEPEKRRISFGLKTSYFENVSDDDSQAQEEAPEVKDLPESDEQSTTVANTQIENGLDVLDQIDNNDHADAISEVALEAGGFDWDGQAQQRDLSEAPSDTDKLPETRKKHRRNSEIQVDHTGDLDTLGPRSVNDFERLLLGQRDSSSLWVQYMAFYLQLSEVEQARSVAERALKEINMREQEEKMNVWVAYLNLENAYGTDDTIEDVFTRACEVNDGQEMHERLTSIYIESGKHKKADNLFQAMTKKKAITQDPKLWLNYANFLMSTLAQTDRARDLLDRGMKSVPSHLHRDLVSKFAQLEFKCNNGDPERGRTMFERLLDTYPKKWDLWDVLIEMEISHGERANARNLYERMSSVKMKSRRAKLAFKMWLKFEEENGDQKKIDHVKAKAAEYVSRQKAEHDEKDI